MGNENIKRTGSGKKRKSTKKTGIAEKWKALGKWQKAVVIAAVTLVIVIIIAAVSVWAVYSGFRTNLNKDNLGISDDIYNSFGDTDVINVAVFGLDTRNENSFKGRSDSIIIVSINPVEKTVKLTSILRDSYVAIEGYKNQKITHAYAFGGAELAIQTLNRNFHLNIQDYATINFYKLAKAIDVLGGVDVDITESEMHQINDIGDDEGRVIEQVTEYGHVHLNGDQAAVFVRLRKYDSDVARSNRQKMVINALIEKARQVNPTEYAKVVKSIMSLCETSLSFSEVMTLVPLINEDIKIQTLTIPNEDEAIGGVYEGAWVWRYDLDKASHRILEFIYGNAPTFSYNANDLFTQPAESNNNNLNNNNKNDNDNEYEGVTIIQHTEPATQEENTTEYITEPDVTQSEQTTLEQNTQEQTVTVTEPVTSESTSVNNLPEENESETQTAYSGDEA